MGRNNDSLEIQKQAEEYASGVLCHIRHCYLGICQKDVELLGDRKRFLQTEIGHLEAAKESLSYALVHLREREGKWEELEEKSGVGKEGSDEA